MNPTAPAANPTTANSNQPYGGFGQAQSDYGSAKNILNFLPTQEAGTTAAATNANTNTNSILPNISVNAPTYTAPTAQVINPGAYGEDLTGYNAATQAATQALTSGENQTYGNAMGQLQQAESQYGNLTPVYQNLANSYGIPGYQNDIATLTGLLQNLNRDVNAQTTLGGGLMTESARDEAYTNQAQPLQQSLNSAGEFLQYGQQDVNNLLDTYEKSLSNALNPLQTNIASLPTLFGQTNDAAQQGYSQGEQSIESTIQNRQKQQELAISQGQLGVSQGTLALQQKAYNAQYGSGTMTDLLNKLATGSIPGMSLKNSASGGGAGYNFQVNNTPASAGTWASTNNLPINYVLSTMASKGDQTAEAALSEVTNAGGVTQSIVNKYPSLFWTPNSNNSASNSSGLTQIQVGNI